MEGNYIKSADESPPLRDERIRAHWNDMVIPEHTRQEKLNNLKERRCLLLGLIQKDLWKWEDVTG